MRLASRRTGPLEGAALTFEQLKALTPMQTLDEAALSHMLLDAARGAKSKIDQLEGKLWVQ
jgi:hypothetical protein